MAKPSMPRKLKASDYMIYTTLLSLFEGFCTMVGTAMDCTLDIDGNPDLSQISIGMERVVNEPGLILMTLSNPDSYAVKCVLAGTFGVGLYALYKYSEGKKRLHRQGVEHGSAKWAEKKEIRSLADKTHHKEFLPLRSADGRHVFDARGNFVGIMTDENLLLAKDVYLALDAKQHLLNLNILIIGGSGSGKTRFFAKPNILQLNTSYVITDPKGEILQSTGKLLTEAGYEVRVLNLIEMEHSHNYNPFHYVYDQNGDLSEDNIKKMVHVLYSATKGDGEKDDFWAQKGQTMLEAIVFLLFEESEYNADFDEHGKIIQSTRDLTNLNFYAVTEKMRKLKYPPRGSQKPDGFFLERAEGEDADTFRKRQNEAFLCPLDRDFLELKRRKPDSLAYRLYCEVRNAPEETGQSFLSSANVKTFMFNLKNLKNLTCCDTIELEKLGDRKSALFLILSATDSTYNFMASMLYTQMFDVLSNRANFKYGGKLPVHVRCIMDEFANLPQIPDFEKVIAFVRSMGMSLNVIVQNLAQLKAKYEKTWEVITGNCDSLLFLGGKEDSTLKYISEALGKETIDVRGHNKTKGKQPSTSENNSIMGRELMLPSEIATMPITDCIIMIRAHNAIYKPKFDYTHHVNYKYTADYDPANAFDVHTLHTVTVAQFMQKSKRATNGTTEIRSEKSPPVYIREPVEIIYESYADAEQYADAALPEITEEYAETAPKYGAVSDWVSFELGEPIRGPRKEVMPYEDGARTVEPEICRYAVPDGNVQHIEDLQAEDVGSVTELTEHYTDVIPDNYWKDIDDYGTNFMDDYAE